MFAVGKELFAPLRTLLPQIHTHTSTHKHRNTTFMCIPSIRSVFTYLFFLCSLCKRKRYYIFLNCCLKFFTLIMCHIATFHWLRLYGLWVIHSFVRYWSELEKKESSAHIHTHTYLFCSSITIEMLARPITKFLFRVLFLIYALFLLGYESAKSKQNELFFSSFTCCWCILNSRKERKKIYNRIASC